MSLKAARLGLLKAREHLTHGVDPSLLRKTRKASQIEAAANTFEAVAQEWFAKQKPSWAERHWTKVPWMLERNLYPWLGKRPISEIKPTELLDTLPPLPLPGWRPV